MAASTCISLVEQFDDIVAATDVLCAGIEGDFAKFIEKTTTDIRLKHARNAWNAERKQNKESDELIHQYERQFTIIKELLSNDQKIGLLNEDEKRSLAFLKDQGRKSSLGTSGLLSESSVALSPSEVSLDPSEEDVSILRDGKKWKRRRTASLENDNLKSPPRKLKRSFEGNNENDPPLKKTKSSLSPVRDLKTLPSLEKNFKRPCPDRKRRTPSRDHLKRNIGLIAEDLEVSSPPAPSAPPISFEEEEPTVQPSAPPPYKMYPELPLAEKEGPEPTPALPAAVTTNVYRNHTFFNKTTLKSELCQVCNKAVKFGKTCLKCRDCRTVCHPECKDKAALPCVPCVPTPNKKKMHEADLASFCPQCVPRVPAIVVHCVHEIERRALADVGIYRVPGSDKMVKELKERLLKAKGNPSFLESVQDINVVCGVLKDFLRGLREPLLTFRMHNAFMQAAESDTEENGLASTLEAIAELPPANKDTLAFIILHLQKVASYSESNKMPTASLAKVFGPTIVGHACANPEPSDMWKDTQLQPKVVQRLMGISGDYWKQYLSPVDNPDPQSPAPSVQSSPGMASPSTPEQRPVPESPFLGSCQSPRMPMKTPVSAPWSASKPKRAGTFFAPPN
ncbi:hypothetical protein EMCRGX_G014128 [Ephydatia muelleri]